MVFLVEKLYLQAALKRLQYEMKLKIHNEQ